jgi:hypothetical protein
MTQYYSNTKEDYVNINDMHHQHVWYAFKKLCDRLEELEMSKKIWSDCFDSTTTEYVRKDVYELLFDKCEQLERENYRIKDRLTKTNKGYRYVFSNIPNTEEGRQIIHKLRKWLNKDSYNMRIRGQYLDKTKLSDGETWRDYDDGQPLSKSKCVRVYLDQKRESA